MVFQLMEEVEADGGDYPLGYYVEAAKDYDDIDRARKYLIKPCPICGDQYPVHEVSWPLLSPPTAAVFSYPGFFSHADRENEPGYKANATVALFLQMVNMPGCTDILCKDCFKGHFTVVIKEQSVKHFNCPMCSEPDLANRDDSQAMYLELFVSLVSPLCVHNIELEIHESLK